MSKVLLYRSRIVEAITRGSRQINGGTVCISRNYDTCKVLHRNHQLIWTNYLESNAFKVLTAAFHSSPQVRRDEPLEASREKNEDKQSPRDFEEDGRGSGQQFEEDGREADHEPVWDNSEPRNDGRESVIERLRRLSMTPADHYRLSPMAEEKAREMEQVRRETIQKGEQWKWDQRNIRPGGPGPQRGGYGGNRRDDYGGNFGNYGNRGRGRYDEEDDYYEPEQRNRWSRNHQSTFDDRRMGPSFGDRQRAVREEDFDEVDESRDSYEEEMEKLRARLAANKEKLKAELEKRSKEGNAAERNVSSSSESFQEASVDGPSSLGNTQDPQANLKLALSDPDTFGNLSFSTSVLVKDRISEEIRNELLEEEKALSPLNEEEEEDDTRFIPPYGERWTNNKLVRKVRELLKEKKLKEAVDTFLGVLKQGGFQFDDNELRHHFNVLINECAAVGYVEMAFRLFNLMKKRGYKENCRTISSLLNACANSPWDKENNIDRIDKLLINMKDRGRTPNLINYHAMIKAYGRLGETVRAFHVVDKMIEESDIKPVTETYNMLLQACISDTKNGFRYTLITWRKMWSTKKVRPDIYSFNLLLRAVRDCGIELTDLELLEEGKSDNSNKQLQKRLNSGEAVLPPIVTQGDSNKVLDFLIPENTAPREGQLLLENLGEPTALDVKVLMKALQYPSNRLQVLGGLRGIISQMARCKVPPNLKTLTELVQVSSDIDIHDILQLLDTYKIKPDHAFFCVALKKLYGHDNHFLAKEVLKLMNNVYHLTPNLVIYSVMAQGCRSWKDAKELLAEMDETNFLPEIYVMGSLLGTAVRTCDPKYALHVLNETKRREIPVNEAFLLKIDNFIKATQRGVVGHEWGKPVENKELVKALETNPDFGRDFGLLKMTYNTWIQTVDVKVYPENPWKAEWEYFKAHKKHRPVETDDLKYESMLNASSSSNA